MKQKNIKFNTFPMYGLFLVFLQFFTLFLLFLSGPITPNNIFSIVLLIISVSLGLYSIWTMRKSKLRVLPTISKGATLVTSGPYGVIRHPMYTTVIIGSLSMFLNDISLTRFIIFAVLVATHLFKLEYEEKLLASHFNGYQEYRKRTAKLIPFIY